ncbi:MAG: DUF58 domain-containing protein, partial [Candidatus Limnocylindrales bacterium]
ELLTSRGWAVAIGVALLAVSGALWGIGELYPVAVAGAVALCWAVAWCKRCTWRIDVGREVVPTHVEAGHRSTVTVSLRNRSARRTPILVARDPFDRGRLTTRLVVAPLQPGERRVGSYQLPATGRGVYRIGPLSLEAVDPLGLARRTRTASRAASVVVHPRVERLLCPPVRPGADTALRGARPVLGRDNDEFANLRDYRPGDDIRRLHWPSTARLDTLMVREDHVERRGQLAVVIDAKPDRWIGPAFERAVSAAASIAASAIDQGQRARLLTTDGTDSGIGDGEGHRARIMELLAVAAPRVRAAGDLDWHPRPELSGLAEGGTMVVVTSDLSGVDELRRAARRAGTGELIMLLVQRPGSPVDTATRSAGRSVTTERVVCLPTDAELAPIWDRSL